MKSKNCCSSLGGSIVSLSISLLANVNIQNKYLLEDLDIKVNQPSSPQNSILISIKEITQFPFKQGTNNLRGYGGQFGSLLANSGQVCAVQFVESKI